MDRHRPLFLTLRDGQGRTLAGGMLPRGDGPGTPAFVARGNHDPYVEHAAALVELGKLYGFDLRDGRAYPAGYPYDSLRGKAAPPVDAPVLARIDPVLV